MPVRQLTGISIRLPMCAQFEARLYLNFLKHHLHLSHPLDAQKTSTTTPMVIAPTLGAPIIIQNPEHGGLEVIPARFGLIPHWYHGSLRDWKTATFNARLDTAAKKPVFNGAWRYRRALVPADAFYEWSGPKTQRQKWRITRGDNQPLAFAALWDEAQLLEGEIISFTLLTRDAGPDMAAIHDREPIPLHPDQWEKWLRRQDVDLGTPAPLMLTAA